MEPGTTVGAAATTSGHGGEAGPLMDAILRSLCSHNTNQSSAKLHGEILNSWQRALTTACCMGDRIISPTETYPASITHSRTQKLWRPYWIVQVPIWYAGRNLLFREMRPTD